MKKLTLSLLTVLAISNPVNAAQSASNSYAPVAVEPMPNSEVESISSEGGFYLGLSYSTLGVDFEQLDYIYLSDYGDTSSVMGEAGYRFNPYIAIEGRYWSGDNAFDAWGLYLKPTLPLGDVFNIYGLIGYGNAGIDLSENAIVIGDEGHYNILDESTMQWGLGVSVSFTENFSIFADYVEIYNDQLLSVDWSLDTINLGVAFQF